MAFSRQLYIETDTDIDPRAGRKFEGGTFNVQTMMAYEGRGFVEMMYYRMDGKKEDLEGRYAYELGHFNVSDFKDETGKMKLAKGQHQALKENYLGGLQETGLQEDRLIKLDDDVSLEAKIAELLKQPVSAVEAKQETVHRPSFDGTSVSFGPAPGMKR